MSWSFYATGAAGAVRKKAKADFGVNSCHQPEEAIRQMAGLALDMALAGLPSDYPVQVSATGSQTSVDGGQSNNLTLEVKPIYGYVK